MGIATQIQDGLQFIESPLKINHLQGTTSTTILQVHKPAAGTPSLEITGNLTFDGDSRYIDLAKGTTNSQPFIRIGEQSLYGFSMRWDSGSHVQFDGWWNSTTGGNANRDFGSLDINNRIWELEGGLTLNGNTVWHAGNDGSGSTLDADTVDGVHASAIVHGNNTSGTNEGNVSNWNSPTKSGFYSHSGASNRWTTPNWSSIIHHKLYDNNNNYASQIGFDTYDAEMYYRMNNNGTWTSWQRIFMDDYHPNADKWTTARTITLGGDLSGSVSIDGSANVTLTATIMNPDSFQKTTYQETHNANDYDASSGTWSTAENSSWGLSYKIGDAYAYNDGSGMVKYNVPSGYKTAYIAHLRWDSGGHFDVYAEDSSGNLILRGRFSSYQNVENSNHNGNHDGQTVIKVSGLGGMSSLRIQNRSGRIHLQGIGWSKEEFAETTDWGTNWNTILNFPGTVWHSANDGSGSGLDADTVDGIQSSRIIYGDNSTGTDQITGAQFNPAGHLKSGFYQVGGTNSTIPNATSVNFVTHTSYNVSGNTAGFDLAVNDSTTSKIYFRPATGGGRGSWQTIWTSSSDGSGSGLDADTVDGQHLGTSAAAAFDHLNLGGATGDNGEDLKVGGIRGRFANEHIQLYKKVGIGYPSGWDGDNSATPSHGLAVYGGATLAYNNGGVSIGQAYSSGDHSNTSLEVNGDASLRSGSYLYFGQTTTLNSWKTRIGSANTSTMHINAQGLDVNNAGYASPAVTWLKANNTEISHKGNTIWHAGNDGSGTGLDADLLDGYQLNGGSGSIGEKVFNNQGRNHNTYTNFNDTGIRAGVNYLQGGTNGPTGTAGHQWYGFRLGLGDNYGTTTGTSGHYASELYWGRKNQTSNDYYIYTRDMENSSWGSWVKMYAGKADAWTTGRTITLSGDLNGSVTLDGSANVTLSAQVVNNSHTHDDRYYTESEMQTFFKRGYIEKVEATNLAVGWYTIATNTGDRALGEFQIWDTASSDHQSVLFNASHHFGTNSSNDITVLANSRYSGTNFRYIRIKENSTYDGAAIQVYIDATSNNVKAAIVGGNAQENGWVLKDWIADATDPGDVDGWANFSEQCRVDLDVIINGGIMLTGHAYTGGSTTQYRVLNTSDEGSGNGLDADTVDGFHVDANSGGLVKSYQDQTATFHSGVSSYRSSMGMVYASDGPNSGSDWYRFIQPSYREGSGGSNVWQTQLAFYGTGGDFWLRQREGGNFGSSGWGSWHRVWTSNTDGSGTGLDADLLDGQQNTQFLRKLSGGSEANIDTYNDNGIRTISYTGHSRHLMSFNLGGSPGTTQQEWHYNGQYRFRNKVDNNNWSSWRYVVSTTTNQDELSGTVWHSGNDGPGSGLNADELDGLNVHNTQGTQNSANTILRTQVNGYTMLGWINTTSGDMTNTLQDRIYCSNDGYIRYVDLASFRARMNVTAKTGYQGRESSTTDTSYWVGAMGWGTTDFNDVFHYGSGTIDSWSSPGNQPSTETSHWVGSQHLHYTNGTNAYGHQILVGAGSPGLMYIRGRWGSSFTSWSRIWNEANDGPGTGLNADLLDGIQGDSFLRSDTSDVMSGELNVSHNSGVTGTSVPNYTQVNIEMQTSSNHVPAISWHRGGHSATVLYEYNGELYVNAWTTRSQTGKLLSTGNEGHGGGIDADTVDGIEGASLLRSDATDTFSGSELFIGGTLKMTNAKEIQFDRGSSDYSTRVFATNHPPAGYTSTSQNFWVGLASKGGTHVIVNTDGSYNSSENAYDHFTIWQNNISNYNARQFYVTNTGNVYAKGDVTAFQANNMSDIRLKKDIKPIENALDIVDKLNGVTFTWKRDEKKSLGFIAQDVEKVVPELVDDKPAIDDPNTLHKTVNYANMVAILTEAVKELKAEVEELKKQIK